ncbi:MAG: DUF928 domain-containing protein [Desmonostoc vinosum HA7617-LM4]|jgi:hypothetical protein|nr:DUF928 domain-containing protein [Desmonostoc vinosum HA7617-LM4]
MKPQIVQLFSQNLNLKLTTSFFLCLYLVFTPATIASFAPTNRKPASDHSRTGGTRGCEVDKIPLTLLAPKTYIGTTASLRPTFVGFVSTSKQIRFKIFEFNSKNQPQQLGDTVEKNVSPGVFQLSLTENQPELIVGRKYLWMVALDCPNSSKTKLVEKAEFIVVEMPSTLKTQLSTAVNSLQKANIYAKADLWYEALAEALKSTTIGKLGQVGLSLVQDLAKSELATTNSEKNRVQNLEKIVIQEK